MNELRSQMFHDEDFIWGEAFLVEQTEVMWQDSCLASLPIPEVRMFQGALQRNVGRFKRLAWSPVQTEAISVKLNQEIRILI